MSYELHGRKHIGDELRKTARRQLRRATTTLEDSNADTFATAVHESRKSVKKVRAIVKVLEEAGARIRQKDSRRLKRASRELSRLRDSAAVVETFDRVRHEYPKRLPEHTYAILRRSLIRSRDQQERRARRDGTIGLAMEQLEKARESANDWKAAGLDLRRLVRVIARSYRRSRKAMRRATAADRSAAVHRWRKALKTLWYQLRLAKPLTPGTAAFVADLKRLETELGEDHNLVVLGGTLRLCRDLQTMRDDVRLVEQMARRMRVSLRKRARSLGRRLHHRDPDAFARWLRRLSKQNRRRPAA